MRIQPTVSHLGGIVSVSLQAQFVGDVTDANDKALILAYGDPHVNLAGQFVDPGDPNFIFSFGAPSYVVGITQGMSNCQVQFMSALPPADLSRRATQLQGPLQVVVSDPVRAARLWKSAMIDRISYEITKMRQQPLPLTDLPSITV